MKKLKIPFEQIKEHYELEKRLANELRQANAEERRSLYNSAYDEIYSKISYLLPQQRAISSRELHNYVRMLKRYLNPAVTFLEIGPGNCILSFEVSKYVKFVYAVDVSTEVTKNFNQPKNFKLVISDGQSIPVPSQTVDFAYSDQLMEHLHPDDALLQLQNIYKALKNGGKYLCVTPNRLSGPHDISVHFDQEATGFHLKEYTASELVRIFKQVGFRKCKLLLGTKGFFIQVPCAPMMLCEYFLGQLPVRLGKTICRFLPIRLLLGVKIIGIK